MTMRVCVDKELPPEARVAAMQRAVAERPGNAPSRDQALAPLPPQELAALTAKKWAPGRVLRVRFLGGSALVQSKVRAFASEWTRFANIGLSFDNSQSAEIRIAFASGGSWSYIGTDALSISGDKPTMNFGWLQDDTADDEFSRVIVHEFGHALGCIHEHQHPLAGVPWDRDAVYKFYMGPPNNWTREQVDGNIFARYDRNISQFSAYDPTSIMHYPIPPELTTNGFSVGWNQYLSPTDKDFARALYPGQPAGQLFFYSASNGHGAAGPVGSTGAFRTTWSTADFSAWTHVVFVAGNHLFFYNANNGHGTSGVVDASGAFRTTWSAVNFASGWTHVVPVADRMLFFYNASNGHGASGPVDASGAFRTTWSTADFSAWTHVVAVAGNILFFYNANNGHGASGVVDASGAFRGTWSTTSFSVWTHVVAVADNILFFYNANNGHGASGVVDASGAFQGTWSTTDFSAWTHVVAVAGNILFFYNANNGHGASGVVDSSGAFRTTWSSLDFSTGWTHIAGRLK